MCLILFNIIIGKSNTWNQGLRYFSMILGLHRHEKQKITLKTVKGKQCDECDFWGPNAQTMKMHFQRLHSENVACGICSLEMKDIETLDIHTSTCEIFKCSWCDNSFNNVSDIKSHS